MLVKNRRYDLLESVKEEGNWLYKTVGIKKKQKQIEQKKNYNLLRVLGESTQSTSRRPTE